MAGSMDSFHEYFDPLFELVVHLHAEKQLRVNRVHERELKLFGKRISAGGDMYEEHQKFLRNCAGYDYGIGNCTLQKHEEWLKSLHCRLLRLDGAQALEKNLKAVVDTYKGL